MPKTRAKKPARTKLAARLQYGALTYRKAKISGIEILLMTSRETKRWIIPKGWPIKGLKPCESAAQEAYEEAGVRGDVGRRPIGKYTYDKRLEPPSKVVPARCRYMPYGCAARRRPGPKAAREKSGGSSPTTRLRWLMTRAWQLSSKGS